MTYSILLNWMHRNHVHPYVALAVHYVGMFGIYLFYSWMTTTMAHYLVVHYWRLAINRPHHYGLMSSYFILLIMICLSHFLIWKFLILKRK